MHEQRRVPHAWTIHEANGPRRASTMPAARLLALDLVPSPRPAGFMHGAD